VRNLASLSSALLLLASLAVANHTSAQNPPPDGAEDAAATEQSATSADEAGDAHQPDQEQVGALLDEEARTRFRLGSTLYRQGRFDDAAREFRAAYEVSHRPELLYNLYLVERDAGNTREAAEALRTYLNDAADVPDRGLMEGRLAALDRQLANAAERATSDGGADEGTSDVGTDAGTTDTHEEPMEAPPREPPSRALPIALMAGGGAVLAAGAVFAILAKGKYSDLNDGCDEIGFCGYDGAQGDIDALQRDGLLADLSFGIGGAAVAAGVLVWLLQGGGDTERAEGTPRFTAGCGADGCGLGLEGSF
jgi:tetratricopeptide (TPR) repeat protein